MTSDSGSRPVRRLIWLPMLVIFGLAASAWQPFSLADLLMWGRAAASAPEWMLLIVLAMALMVSFGLPGSLALWVIAPFHPPVIATLLLLAGGVGGALGAYLLSTRLRGGWQPGGLARPVFEMLERRGDLPTQLALRVLPGFPHALVNFAAGILRLPMGPFLAAATVGLAVKFAVYASAVHGLVDALETGSALQPGTLAPLLALSLLLLIGTWTSQRMRRIASRSPH